MILPSACCSISSTSATPACPLCGYNLRSLPAPRCPECGQKLRLTVGLAEPFLRAWIAATVAACACGGIGALFLIVLLNVGLPYGRNAALLTLVILYFIASMPLAVALIAGRRRFLRIEASRQSLLALLVVLMSLLALMLFWAVVPGA